jgi:glutathione S-transferase
MKFYYAPKTISVATAVMLEETGLPYNGIKVDFANQEQTSPEYLGINPKGRVPALVTDAGILTETGAILEYLATQAPDKVSLPIDPWAVAQLHSVMYYLASTFHVNHSHLKRGSRWANEESSLRDMTAKVPETMAASARFIEENCALAPFVMGDAMTPADPWLFAICTWLEGDGVDIRKTPKLAAHFDMMNARPSVAAVRKMGILD